MDFLIYVISAEIWSKVLYHFYIYHSLIFSNGKHLFDCNLRSFYTVLQKYAHIGLKQKLLRSITLDIITRLLDNAAFVCIHVVGRFSEDFSEVRALRSRGFQLKVEWRTTVLCVDL